MKRVIAFLLVVVLCFTSTACKGLMKLLEDDNLLQRRKIVKVLNAIQQKDAEMLKDLFSRESICQAENFEKSIQELFDYFQGEVQGIDDTGDPYVERTFDYGDFIEILESSYEIKTTQCDYRIALRYVTEDTTNEDNVGIISLCVIKREDDYDTTYTYWGDGKFAPGIHVGLASEWLIASGEITLPSE